MHWGGTASCRRNGIESSKRRATRSLAAAARITHHHAVGREHRPWYDKERPDLFAAAIGAVKRALDPQGLLNPGVLIDAKLMDQF